MQADLDRCAELLDDLVVADKVSTEDRERLGQPIVQLSIRADNAPKS